MLTPRLAIMMPPTLATQKHFAFIQQPSTTPTGTAIIATAIVCSASSPPFHPSAATRAFTLNQMGRHREALADCDSAILADSTYAKAHLRKGGALEGLGRYAEAKGALTKVQRQSSLARPILSPLSSLIMLASGLGSRFEPYL